MLITLLSVALGGAIGASGRYLTNVALGRLFGMGYPFGTLAVNILGSLLMGVLVVVLARKGANAYAPFLMTGVLGGFTTFSAFSLDTLTLVERGATLQAALYVIITVVISISALVLGVMATRALMPA